MDLRDYLRLFRKHWRLIGVCVALGIGAAAGLIVSSTPLYTATSELFVSIRNPADLSQAAAGGQFVQAQVTSYAAIVTSPEVTEPVINELRLPYTADHLAKEISASVPLNTVLINLSVKDPSAQRAAAIANAASQQLVHLVSTIEKPSSGPALVDVSIVKPATTPLSPSSPRKSIDLVFGALLGLFLGLGAAALRSTLDTTVKEIDGVEALVDVPVLGVITYDPEARKYPLIQAGRGRSGRSEGFRQLRTNLQFVEVDSVPKSLVITSAIPDEGKTTTACNLAITMAQAGGRVLLAEGDLRRPRVASYFGLEGRVGLTNVLIGQATLQDVVQEWGGGLLHVLPSGALPPNPSELLASQSMVDLLRELESAYDIVIIDAPPLLPVTDASVVSTIVDTTLVVARHGHVKREQLARAINGLRTVDAHIAGVVLNMVPTKGPDSSYYGYYGSYHDARRQEGSRPALQAPSEPPVPARHAAGPGPAASANPMTGITHAVAGNGHQAASALARLRKPSVGAEGDAL